MPLFAPWILSAAFIVDPTVQRIADAALAAALEDAKIKGGLVLVGDPNDGRLLAVAAAGSRSDPLAETITPASLMKPILVASAIDRGATSADATHDCENGAYTTGGRTYRDWKAFSRLSTSETLVMSSNICALKIAGLLGAARTREAFAAFGFSDNDAASLADYALGALNVPPLATLQAYGAIANGGELLAPRGASDRSAKVIVRRALSSQTAASVRRMLARVVTDGTGRHVAGAAPAIAGKTGTLDARTGATFAGFSPADDPRLVALVYLDGTDLLGGTDAAPVFARISEQVLALR